MRTVDMRPIPMRAARPALAAACALALAACAAPPFPRQHPYPFGLSAMIESAYAANSGDPARDAARREAAAAAQRQNCPDWEATRLPHPIDPLFPPAQRSDLPAIGCHTQAALDAMVARPDDILRPPIAMGPAPAAPQNRAVARHRETGSPPLPTRSSGVEASR